MTYEELKNKTATELAPLLTESRAAIRTHRFQAAEHQLKNVRAIRELRKRIARLLTRLRTM